MPSHSVLGMLDVALVPTTGSGSGVFVIDVHTGAITRQLKVVIFEGTVHRHGENCTCVENSEENFVGFSLVSVELQLNSCINSYD